MLTITSPLPFKEAIKHAKARGVVLPDEYYSAAYTGFLRSKTFSIAGMAKLDQLQAVLDTLNKEILSKGLTLADFKKLAAKKSWALPQGRLELIMRNHLQNSYQAGHWRNFRAFKSTRPFLMYDAINDSRTRPNHRELDGVIKPVDDPFWGSHSPPLGHNCRCTLRSLNDMQKDRRGGVTIGTPTGAGPDPGWGYHPLDGDGAKIENIKQAKLSKVHPKLKKAALKKSPPAVKKAPPQQTPPPKVAYDPFEIVADAGMTLSKDFEIGDVEQTVERDEEFFGRSFEHLAAIADDGGMFEVDDD